ncbi:guanine nucleotide binding protein (G protein), alpha activating activity polypeptide O isoform 1 [Reticulomyxa filosa]|uniref:Guanine nucleotide binding protein (G protein), alpha activating activity polypeptide O isoform 1 n=1 Tax=Reticulomyxa filosa TaxID=46433 RepID=X6N394_RETFI|nr:guanine nucleotide binding protein (G protein), alpha activating activity polypeptide O isoform 1 [Reticulomyxa filosa]|eukprot:ETO20750.1 guanine nucleotide binding protein (G protein), alpha activating activity polypeptide O isoform 1 [Reticulomyxa filosa]
MPTTTTTTTTTTKGGQRAERKKWIHCFTGVTAVIFVASLSGYDESMYEEEMENVMHDSLDLFSSICKRSYFQSMPMILFLNKVDLFKIKIDSTSDCHVPLTVCFPEYQGKQEYPECLQYIREQFIKCFNNPTLPHCRLFVHVTCAMDSQNVKTVFHDVTHIVIQTTLYHGGFS